MIRFLLSLLGLTIFAVSTGGISCARQVVEFKPGQLATSNAGADKSIHAEMVWLKSKTDSVDLLLRLKNNYGHPVYFKRTSFKLWFNDKEGSSRKNEIPSEFEKGMEQTGIMIFGFEPQKAVKGQVKLVIDPIYSDETMKQPLPAIKLETSVQ